MRILRNQKGASLIGVILASVLVVALALVVGNYVSSISKQSVSISNSTSCQNITRSINDHFTKDGNSLFINSFGPSTGSTLFPNQSGSTTDGYFRMNSNTPVIVISGQNYVSPAPMSSNAPIPQTWRLNNSLNINNSLNRLLAIATTNTTNTQKPICCENLDLNDSDCGDIVYNSQSATGNLQNFPAPPPGMDYSVKLAVNFKDSSGNLCDGRVLNPTNLPVASKGGSASYAFRVTLYPGTPQEEICEANGSAIFSTDEAEPLVLMHIDTSNLCAGGIPNPLICTDDATSSETVTVNLKTVQDTPNCRSQCLSRLEIPSCSATPGPNPMTDAQCLAQCTENDPGSIYFCRIGERNWFRNNPDYWEPCHTAIVHDYNSTPGAPISAGTVNIAYQQRFTPAANRTETTTLATVTLTNLTSDRAYQIDVRAVDTRGLFLGPSFCAVTNTCPDSDSLIPAFAINRSAPVLSPLDVLNEIAGARGGGASVFNGNFQCNNVPVSWSTSASYNIPAGAYNSFGIEDSCTATIGGATATGCSCSGSQCFATVSNFGAASRFLTLSVTTTNACGKVSAPVSYSWCYDPVLSFSPGVAQASNGPSPQFSHTVPAAKACGLAFLCPQLPNGTYLRLNGCSPIPTGWNVANHSGCLARGLQYGTSTYDACGRQANTNVISYESLLGPANTTNQCLEIGGKLLNGNSCSPGFCDNSFQCQSTCTNNGVQCDNSGAPSGDPSAPCKNATDCPGQHGACSTSYKCVAPIGEESSSCINGSSCTITNNCVGRVQRCSGGTWDNLFCGSDTDCPGGTCTVQSPGSCSFTGATCDASGGCASGAGTCQIDAQGTCSCPSNKSCNPCPVPGGSGTEVLCPDLVTCPIPKPAMMRDSLSCSAPPTPPTPGTCTAIPGTCNAACGQTGSRTVTRVCSGGTCVGCTNSVESCTNTCTASWQYDESCNIGTQTCPPGQCTCTITGTRTITNLRCVYSDGNVDSSGSACGSPPAAGGVCSQETGSTGCTGEGGGGCGHCTGLCCMRGGTSYFGPIGCMSGSIWIRCR